MKQKTACKVRKRIWLWVAAIIAVLVIACAVYLSDYYRADTEAIAAFAPEDACPTQVLEDGTMTFGAVDAEVGLVFYPGGRVEHSAYAPLMAACASKGVFCVLVEMPFHLAVLDQDAAAGIPGQYPDVGRWYLGGHSLGGSMAAAYLEDNAGAFSGLILLGAYSTADLSGTGLEVLSLYGSEDHVLNRENYERYRTNLPEGFTEFEIEGGCHAGFGMYGPQRGDGIPAISSEEQIDITADTIAAFITSSQHTAPDGA